MKARVLIAEDELIVASHEQKMLADLGCDVVAVVTTGEEAAEKAIALRPDIVLMDIMLPGAIDGIAAADKILKQCNIPIIYISAYSDEGTLARARLTEPYGFITKPFELSDLRAALEIALYKHTMERRLRESEERFRLLFQMAPIGIVQYTRDLRVRECNHRFADILGVNRDEAVRSDLRTILGASFASALLAPWAGGSSSSEAVAVPVSGRPRASIILRTAPIRGGNGGIEGAIGILEDVTDLRRTEEGLVRLAKLETFVADIAAKLIGSTMGNFAEQMPRIMESVAIFVGAERAFLHLLEPATGVITNVFEWHDPSLDSLDEELRGVRIESFGWTMARLKEGEPVCLLRTEDLPPEASADREFWLSLGFKSLLLAPLNAGGTVRGYLGVSTEQRERLWLWENLRLLRILGNDILVACLRRESELDGAEREEDFQLLVENLNEVTFRLDAKGFITYLSKGVEELTGFRPDELIGESFERFVHPHDRVIFQTAWDAVLSGKTEAAEFRTLTRDGEIRQLRISSRNLTEGGEVVGITGVIMDITEQKEAQQRLAESEARYRRLWEDSTDGLVVIDAESGLIIDCNREFCLQTGRSREVLTSLHIWEIRPAALREAARAKFGEVRDAGTGGSAELCFEKPDGSQVRIDFLSRKIQLGGTEVLQSRCRRLP